MFILVIPKGWKKDNLGTGACLWKAVFIGTETCLGTEPCLSESHRYNSTPHYFLDLGKATLGVEACLVEKACLEHRSSLGAQACLGAELV